MEQDHPLVSTWSRQATRIVSPFAASSPARADAAADAPREPAHATVASTARLPALRAMTGYEEEFLDREATTLPPVVVCNQVLARCMVAPGVDCQSALSCVRALTVAQRDLALITLRRLSLGDEVRFESRCPHCEARGEVDFDLASLPQRIPEAAHDLELTTLDGIAVVIRVPTAGDQEALGQADIETDAERRTWLLAHLLMRFGEQASPFNAEFVRALPTRTRRFLEDELERAAPALDLCTEVTCVACKQPFTALIDVVSFFLPS